MSKKERRGRATSRMSVAMGLAGGDTEVVSSRPSPLPPPVMEATPAVPEAAPIAVQAAAVVADPAPEKPVAALATPGAVQDKPLAALETREAAHDEPLAAPAAEPPFPAVEAPFADAPVAAQEATPAIPEGVAATTSEIRKVAAEAPAARDRAESRDDSSYPPVDLDNHFFGDSGRDSDADVETDHRDPRLVRKSMPEVVRRRADLQRYVKWAVAGASALCLAAVVKAGITR
ncbi:MAG TPA: hypothetical protein VIY73_16510, partial [Polyangiaceae bacterium]